MAESRRKGKDRRVTEKPFAPACERNREPILAVLREQFADRQRVLEIGSGTGQHAVSFAAALPHLLWQTSDRDENLSGIQMWLDEAALPNTPAPLVFDVASQQTPAARESGAPIHAPNYDAIFSANTLHIMSWEEVEKLFAALPALATAEAKLVIYGPFNYAGQFTSASNAAFDESLKRRVPHMGIRDFADVDRLAQAAGFALLDDVAMPANNRCLVWRRAAA
jgi:cyclopropane fatty-acyl-phospholipid synthase-like methyltransferase